MNRQGFVMLITLTTLGLVTAMVLNVWFITSFQRDVVNEREQWYKNFYVTKKALDSVVGQWEHKPCAVPNIIDMTTQELKMRACSLVVSLQRPDKGSVSDVLVNATMRQNSATLCALRCLITKKIVSTEQGVRVCCEVRGFTLVL